MNILAFDTSSSACSVALQRDDKHYALHEVAPMQQAKRILPMISAVLNQAFLSLNQLDGIFFGCGPGSFTGIRIASSVVQGLAFACHLPIISVSSMAAIAQGAYDEWGFRHCLVALDARMNELYWASYVINEAGLATLEGKEEVNNINEIALPDMSFSWYGVGEGWVNYHAPLMQKLGSCLQKTNPFQLPTGAAILKLGVAKFEKGEILTPSQAIPTYLR